MRSLILSACMLASVVSTQAQVTYGPEVSFIGTNYTGKDGGQSLNTKSLVSFRAGGVIDLPISDNFSIQPSLLYVRNGFKASVVIVDETAHVNTLELPVNVMYKIDMRGGGHFFVGLGPYIAYNMSGKAKETDNFFGSGSSTENLKIGSDADSDNIKAFDFGLGINAGYQLSNGLFVRVFYQKGLLNLAPGGDSDNALRSTNYGIGIGMLFGDNRTHAKMKK